MSPEQTPITLAELLAAIQRETEANPGLLQQPLYVSEWDQEPLAVSRLFVISFAGSGKYGLQVAAK